MDNEKVDSRLQNEISHLGVRAVHIHDGIEAPGGDAHDKNVALQIKPAIVHEAYMALVEHSKVRAGEAAVGVSVYHEHGDVVNMGLYMSLAHDRLHTGEP